MSKQRSQPWLAPGDAAAVVVNPAMNPDSSSAYQIRLKGHLGHEWTDWFGGMTIVLTADGDTLLCGTVADQAALHGLLRKVRDLGMPLVSVNQTHSQQPSSGDNQ